MLQHNNHIPKPKQIMKKRQLLLLCLFFISYYSQSQTLIFQSGFESNSQMNNENPDDVDIIGVGVEG